MNRKFYPYVLSAVMTCCLFSGWVLAQEDFYYSRGERIPLTISTERIAIKFKSGVTEAQIQDLLSSEPILGELKPLAGATPDFFTIQLKAQTDVKQLVQRLKNRSEVDIVNPVYLREGSLEAIPFDIFMVQFKPSITRDEIDALNKQHHVEVVSMSPASWNLYTLRITAASDLSVLKMSQLYYESLPAEWSLPDFVSPVNLSSTPNDPYFQYQYYLHNTGQTGGVTDADIDAPEAWDISLGSSSLTISVIDEGVASHEELTLWTNADEFTGDYNGDGRPGVKNVDDDGDGLIDEDSQGRQPGQPGYNNDLKDDDDENGYIDDLSGWDFFQTGDPVFPYGDNNPSPDGNEAHGMACAGIVAGKQNNNLGISGIAPNCKIMAIKIFDAYMNATSDGNIARAIDYAWQNGAHILSNSWGYYGPGADNPNLVPAIVDAINRALNQGRGGKGSVVVFCSGNTANRTANPPDYGYVAFPACVSGVLAVGATDKSNNIQWYSPRDAEMAVVAPSGNIMEYLGYNYLKLWGDFWSTDIAGQPGYNTGDYGIGSPTYYVHYIWDSPGGDSYPPGNYSAHHGGTSAACPQIAGVAALILSINSSLEGKLSNPQIQTIIKNSADDMGTSGYDQDFGYGRINTYQAVNLALAYDNKSTISTCTAYNSPRILARGKNSSSTLHEVFYSGRYDASSDGWEVFYRRSSDNGASWDITERISAGDSHNRRQCISVTDEGNDDGVHVVWQRKKDNGKYQVVYRKSTNTGSSWQDIVLLADDITCSYYQSAGPMPVITSISSGSTYKLIVVWVTSGGLRYRIYNNGQWENTGALDDGSYNSYVWFPSIMGKGSFASLTYDTRYDGVYSRIYNGTTWSSANEVTAGSATVNDRQSQVAIRISNNPIAAWCAQRPGDSDYRILFRSGYTDNTWSSWFEEFAAEAGKNSLCPALTDYSGNGQYAIGIVYHTSDKEIKMKKFVSGDWESYTLNSNGIFANITYESVPNSIPRIIWTDQAGPHYQLVLSSQYLSKSQLLANVVNHRRAVFENKTDHTSLAIETGEITVNTVNEAIFSIDFPPVDIFQKIAINNTDDALYYLIPDTVTLPPDVKQLKLIQIIYTTSPYDSTGPEPGTKFKNFDVELILQNLSKGDSISVMEHYSNNEGKFNLKQEKILDIAKFAGQTIVLKHELHNLGIEERNLTFGAGDIWLEKEGMPKAPPQPLVPVQKPLPQQYQISQNYPNPFNPTTTISYKLPAGKDKYFVTLKIYDALGRLIKVLVETSQASGSYEVIWDGTDLHGKTVASGIYFYTIQAGDVRQTRKMVLMR